MHPTTAELAAYLDRRMPGDELGAFEAHLASCSECRGLLVGAHGVLAAAGRPARRALGAGAIAAAVAAALFVFVRTGESPDLRRHSTLLRDAAGPIPLIAYGPSGEAPVGPLRFTWGSMPGALSYHLTVTRADGEAVWSHDGADTVAVLPSTADIVGGATHFWAVDALLADGTTVTTGLREFVPIR